MNEFEKESATMDMKEEMMSDAVDDAMEDEDEGEGEEVESDKILKEVLDEIGMNMSDSVSCNDLPSTDISSRALQRLTPPPMSRCSAPVLRSRRALAAHPPRPRAAAAAARRTTSSAASTCYGATRCTIRHGIERDCGIELMRRLLHLRSSTCSALIN
jgi:charged multivesicular body protein 2A